jgi:hypothetical protein
LSSATGNGSTPLHLGWREGLGVIRLPETFIRLGMAMRAGYLHFALGFMVVVLYTWPFLS